MTQETTLECIRFDAPDFGRSLSLGVITLSGMAFAGKRGVDRVEASTDDGRTWQRARLTYRGSPPRVGTLALRLDSSAAGENALAVRATDATGAVQTAQNRVAVPEGASGYHRAVARVE